MSRAVRAAGHDPVVASVVGERLLHRGRGTFSPFPPHPPSGEHPSTTSATLLGVTALVAVHPTAHRSSSASCRFVSAQRVDRCGSRDHRLASRRWRVLGRGSTKPRPVGGSSVDPSSSETTKSARPRLEAGAFVFRSSYSVFKIREARRDGPPALLTREPSLGPSLPLATRPAFPLAYGGGSGLSVVGWRTRNLSGPPASLAL